MTVVDCCSEESGNAGLEAAVLAIISSGYSLLTFLLVDFSVGQSGTLVMDQHCFYFLE